MREDGEPPPHFPRTYPSNEEFPISFLNFMDPESRLVIFYKAAR
jgi:hypothetical protein